jgi:hypothetical protein
MDLGLEPCFDGGSSYPNLGPRFWKFIEPSKQVDTARRALGETYRFRRYETVTNSQVAALLEPDLAVLLDKHAMACCDAYRSAVSGLGLVQNFVDGVANYTLDRAKFYLVVIKSKAKDVSERFSHTFGDSIRVGTHAN